MGVTGANNDDVVNGVIYGFIIVASDVRVRPSCIRRMTREGGREGGREAWAES